MGTKELWSTYNNIVINNERAFELIRMVRALLPDEEKSPDDYNFYGVLGIVQDILKNNGADLTRHEEVMMHLDRCLPEKTDEF